MRTWWERTVECLRDYIEVYGWADPTHNVAPTWIDDESTPPTLGSDGDPSNRFDDARDPAASG